MELALLWWLCYQNTELSDNSVGKNKTKAIKEMKLFPFNKMRTMKCRKKMKISHIMELDTLITTQMERFFFLCFAISVCVCVFVRKHKLKRVNYAWIN